MKERIRIDAVIFDYGRVLSLPQRPSDIEPMARICGIVVERFYERYWKFRDAYDRDELNGESYWTRVLADGTRTSRSEEIATLIATDIQSWSRIDNATLRWVESLHKKGMRLALLSNMPADLARSMEKNSTWTQYFDPIIFSCDVGSMKPDSPMYRKCLERLNLPAESVLFLDDRFENVAAATKLGMHSLVFDEIGSVISRVEDLFDLRQPE